MMMRRPMRFIELSAAAAAMRHLLELTQRWIISSDFELHAFRGL
jgi:hypothetical protein